MVTLHAKKGSCANLRNSKTTSDLSLINCSRCILAMNKKVMTTFIKESSKYQHSNFVGVDRLRIIPKWVVMGFQSYTVPGKAIKHAFELPNPKIMFQRSENTQIVTLRELNPFQSRKTMMNVLNSFKQSFTYVLDQINAHTNLNIRFSLQNDIIQVDNPRTGSKVGDVHVLSVTSDLGYIPQFVLSIIIGKIANVRLQRPDLPLSLVSEQIFSNQSNTSQKGYRTLVKAILNGTLYDIEDIASLFPQICGLHHEIVDSMVEPPVWMSLNRSYISELRIVEEGL